MRAGGRRSITPRQPRDAIPRLLGPVEAATILGSMVALFALFAGAQIVTLAGGATHVLETAGLTRAEYARSGFFQLLAVAALTLATLTTLRTIVRAGSARANRRVRSLTFAAIALTLVVVAVSIARLALYVDAYGLSMLRLYTMVFAGWIGMVFAGLTVAVAGVGPPRGWLVPFAAGSGLAVLLVLNVVNPEALVARHNIRDWERTGRLDVRYAAGLSEDAVPVLVDAADRLSPPYRAQLLAALCARTGDAAGEPSWPWNWSRDRAAAALDAMCRTG